MINEYQNDDPMDFENNYDGNENADENDNDNADENDNLGFNDRAIDDLNENLTADDNLNENDNMNENYNAHHNENEDSESSGQSSDSNDDLEDLYHEIVPENIQQLRNGDREAYLFQSLKAWALRGVSLRKVDSLLKILSPLYPGLPKTHTGLLGTPHAHTPDEIVEMGSGSFWYKGIEANLRQRVTEAYLLKHRTVTFDVNMDGFQPFGTTFDDIWPILGLLKDEEEPFIIATYKGRGKPDDINLYLDNYVQEARFLITNGIDLFGNNYPVTIGNYILDAPARSFTKCIIGHNGTFSCEKCEVEMVCVNNVHTYPNLNAPLRDDASFAERRNWLHHTGDSPLEQIPTGMVSQFRLDSLHMVYLGVTKRWLKFVVGTSKRRGILNEGQVDEINNRILGTAAFVPTDFSRRPRPFTDKSKFRATEYRRIVLYDGLVLFKDLDPGVWKTFKLLHSGIYILCSPSLVKQEAMRNIANLLLRRFINLSKRILGGHFISYYVHALCHLSEECAAHGALEDFSAFPYENYLGIIKALLRSTYKPIEQLINRDFERNGHIINPKRRAPGEVTLYHNHVNPEEQRAGRQYTKVEFSDTFLAVSQKDGCFKTKKNEYFSLSNIIYTPERQIVLVGQKFNEVGNYYEYPLPSSNLGIVQVSNLGPEKHYINFSQFSAKCSLLPTSDVEYVAIPLAHTEEL
ncbi:uncharacterized protein LOC117640529 [Thrips palmi]|uniref:Uncharacterized protein LOC117640529 n=1 Tax=Thrips palmi TaxID=161013 RepID=A0A6P8Y9U0_THRPL|nr:uncharacterized protein LOC117640529 [Thrips palmi]